MTDHKHIPVKEDTYLRIFSWKQPFLTWNNLILMMLDSFEREQERFRVEGRTDEEQKMINIDLRSGK
jgi:hypothetical protein